MLNGFFAGFIDLLMAFFLGLFTLFATTGCTSEAGTPEQFEQKLAAADKWSELFVKHGVAGTITFAWRGEGEVYEKCGFGLDTGMDLAATMLFNSAANPPTEEQEKIGPADQGPDLSAAPITQPTSAATTEEKEKIGT